MGYVRKTMDVWHVLVNYGYGDGWEHECTENTWKEAKQRVREYRENVPGVRVKAVAKRERVENQ